MSESTEMAAEGSTRDMACMKQSTIRLRECPEGIYAVVRSFMAHHQGMTFLSLAYFLLDRPMQQRFQSDPEVQATVLLLQERVPKAGDFTRGWRTLRVGRLPPVRKRRTYFHQS